MRLRKQTASAVLVASGVILLALVAVASGAETGGAAFDSTAAGIAIIVLFSAGLVAIAAASVSVSGYAFLRDTRRRTKLAFLTAAVLLTPIAVALVLYESKGTNRPESCQDCAGAPSGGGRAAGGDGGGGGGEDGLILAAVGGVLLALLVAAAIAAVVLRRRRPASADAEPAVVMDALDESLDDLRRESDTRRAIVACYARMERAFERVGSARRPAEAPLEYLVRVLERITTNSRAARSLTELFEQAKFSVEPMGEADKQAAIRALELLRAEVAHRS